MNPILEKWRKVCEAASPKPDELPERNWHIMMSDDEYHLWHTSKAALPVAIECLEMVLMLINEMDEQIASDPEIPDADNIFAIVKKQIHARLEQVK